MIVIGADTHKRNHMLVDLLLPAEFGQFSAGSRGSGTASSARSRVAQRAGRVE
jgi:hypothetical protein